MMIIVNAIKDGQLTRFQFGCMEPARIVAKQLKEAGYFITYSETATKLERSDSEVLRAVQLLTLIISKKGGNA